MRNEAFGRGTAGTVSFPASSSSFDHASGDFSAALEASANAGGPFWIGGSDEMGGLFDEDVFEGISAFGMVPRDDPLWEEEAREMFGLIDEDGEGKGEEEAGGGFFDEGIGEIEGDEMEMEVDVPVDPRLL